MKKKVSMSVKTLVCALMFAAGAFFSVVFGSDWHNSMNPIDMSLVGAETLKNGMYVNCKIDSYYGAGCEILGMYDYFYCTVELYDGSFIEMGVYDLDMKDKLEGYKEGLGSPVTFMGKVSKRKTTFDTSSYKNAGVDPNKVSRTFCIEQTVEHAAQNRCLIAVFVTIVSLIGFFTSFKVRYVDEAILDNKESTATDEERNKYGNGSKRKVINLDYEHDVAVRKMERIQHQMERQRRLLIPGIAFIIAGGVVIYFSRDTYLILGIVLVLYGLIKLWKVFFNSGSKLALGLAEVFSINTLYKQYKHAEAQCIEIENELCNKKMKDEKIFSSMGRSKDKAIVIDCDEYPRAFMIRIERDKLYSIKYGEDAIQLKVVTDVLLREEQYLMWGNRKKDISRVLEQARRELFFIHFDEVDALWMIADDEDYSVAPVSVFRLYSNGNISMENINAGLIYDYGDVLDPRQLMLKRAVYCVGPVVTTAEYYLNNLAKPQLSENGNLYYYVDEEYAREIFEFGTEKDIYAWKVPVQEDDIDISVEKAPVVRIPGGTKFCRLRVPRRASHSYIDLGLEDGSIIRVMEEHRTVDDQPVQIMMDANKEQFTYRSLG